MRLRHARARFTRWFRPTLLVPVSPARPLDGPALIGCRRDGVTVLSTPLGEIAIPADCRVSVIEVAHAVAWIAALPVAEPVRYQR